MQGVCGVSAPSPLEPVCPGPFLLSHRMPSAGPLCHQPATSPPSSPSPAARPTIPCSPRPAFGCPRALPPSARPLQVTRRWSFLCVPGLFSGSVSRGTLVPIQTAPRPRAQKCGRAGCVPSAWSLQPVERRQPSATPFRHPDLALPRTPPLPSAPGLPGPGAPRGPQTCGRRLLLPLPGPAPQICSGHSPLHCASNTVGSGARPESSRWGRNEARVRGAAPQPAPRARWPPAPRAWEKPGAELPPQGVRSPVSGGKGRRRAGGGPPPGDSHHAPPRADTGMGGHHTASRPPRQTRGVHALRLHCSYVCGWGVRAGRKLESALPPPGALGLSVLPFWFRITLDCDQCPCRVPELRREHVKELGVLSRGP